eukprot:gene16180-19762_t
MTEPSSSVSKRIKVKPDLPHEVRRSSEPSSINGTSGSTGIPASNITSSSSKVRGGRPKKHESESSLAQLSEGDKQKVARLVNKLLQLGAEHDALQQQLQKEREDHSQALAQLAAGMEGQLSIIEDQLRFKDESIAALQAQEAMLTSLLALYQGKLKNLHEILQLASVSSSQQAEQLRAAQ